MRPTLKLTIPINNSFVTERQPDTPPPAYIPLLPPLPMGRKRSSPSPRLLTTLKTDMVDPLKSEGLGDAGEERKRKRVKFEDAFSAASTAARPVPGPEDIVQSIEPASTVSITQQVFDSLADASGALSAPEQSTEASRLPVRLLVATFDLETDMGKIWETETTLVEMESEGEDSGSEVIIQAMGFALKYRGRRMMVFCEDLTVLALAVNLLDDLCGFLKGQTVINWYVDEDVFETMTGVDAETEEEEEEEDEEE